MTTTNESLGVTQISKSATKTQLVRAFSEQLKEIYEAARSIANLAYEVGKNKMVVTQDGREIRKREVNGLCTSLCASIKSLRASFSTALNPRRPRKPNAGNNVGFTYVLYVTENLSNFFTGDEEVLGLVDPSDESKGFLSSQLYMLKEHRLTNQHILTVVMYVYIFVHKLQKPNDGRYIKADKRMHEFFGEQFKELAKGPERINDKGNVIPPIDPDNMMMASCQTIVAFNRVRSLTVEEEEFSKKEEVKTSIADEEALVVATMKYYRKERDRAKETRKTKEKENGAPVVKKLTKTVPAKKGKSLESEDEEDQPKPKETPVPSVPVSKPAAKPAAPSVPTGTVSKPAAKPAAKKKQV